MGFSLVLFWHSENTEKKPTYIANNVQYLPIMNSQHKVKAPNYSK